MGKARHPRTYNEGQRKQMTPEWKALVLARLKENKRNGKKPGSIGAMANMLLSSDGKKADKTGIGRTFNTDQTSSSYVDAICELLEIAPPLAETSPDPELEKDLAYLRDMDPDRRREIMNIARRMK